MKLSKLVTKKGLLFLLIFSILVFVGDRINFSKLVGAENQFFTLFQFFGPIAKDKISFLVPVLAIILFITHPVGRQVWFFALFWTIPIIIKLLPKKYGDGVLLRSLGATFTAHAVGGAMWNYIVPMTPQAWIALIPIVIYERLLFAGGIAISFVALNTLLDKLDIKTKAEYVNVDRRYVLFKHIA